MKRFLAYAAWLVVSLFSAAAWAQNTEHAKTPADMQPTTSAQGENGGRYYYMDEEKRWYGWQPLIIDVPALATMYLAGRDGKWGLGGAAAGIYVIGGPAIHLMHRRPPFAALSGISRMVIPMAFFVVTPIAMNKLDQDTSVSSKLATSFLVGGLATSALDALLFSTENVEVERRFDARRGPSLTPLVAASQAGITIGLQATGW